MTVKLALEAIESVDLPKMTLAERLVYIYLLRDSDKYGSLRLSQSDLGARLGVTRQTIVKHVDALTEKRLVTRQGHGRYRVFAEPWSVENVARRYVENLPPWAEFDVKQVAMLVYGESNDLDWDSGEIDQRIRELDAVEYRLQTSGLLTMDDDGTMRKPRVTTRR